MRKLTAEIVESDLQGVRKGELVEERMEEVVVNEVVVRSKTHSSTSVEVSFLFNNNLEYQRRNHTWRRWLILWLGKRTIMYCCMRRTREELLGGVGNVLHLPAH